MTLTLPHSTIQAMYDASESKSSATAAAEARIEEVASGFESVFLHMLLEPLEKVGEAFFGGGATGRIFGGQYRQQLSDAMATAKPLGIAKMVEETVRRQQGLVDPADSNGSDELHRELGQLRAQQSYGRNMQ